MNNESKKHCGKIGLMKFIFALTILARHIGARYTEGNFLFGAGSIAVEFFFIVSGFLFCKKYINYDKKESIGDTMLDFIIKKLKQFLPFAIILLIIATPFLLKLFNYDLEKFIYILYTLLYIPVKAAHQDLVFQIFWYISAMVIVQSLLLPFLLKYKKKFAEVVSPLLFFFFICYFLIKFQTFDNPWDTSIFGFKGIVRALTFINLGMYLYTLHDRLKKVEYTKLGKIILLIIENIGYLSILYLMNAHNAHARFDLLMVLIFAVCILISFSGKLKINNIFNNKFVYKLEQISLPIYVNQFLVQNVLIKYDKIYNWNLSYPKFFAIELAILLIIGFIEIYIINIYNKNSNKFFNLFIKRNSI